MDIVYMVLLEIWATLLRMAPYLLFGYLIAGVLSVVVKPELVQRHLGGQSFLSILKASVLGLPLPLCSCGVLPVTASLRKQGAGRGAAAAFLVATPTIGVDSFMATMGLLGPIMAVYRMMMSAFLGIYGGLMANWFGREPQTQTPSADKGDCPHCAAARAAEEKKAASCCAGGTSESSCGSAHEPENTASVRPPALLALLWQALVYGYYRLPKDIAKPLLGGIVVAGLISALVKLEVLTPFLGGGPGTLLLMLVTGIPLYVCSTVAIPLALGFMALGATPGAAMTFMLVAPATNAATLGILVKMIGGRTTLSLVLALMSGALAGGLALDYLWPLLGLPGLSAMTAAAGVQAAHAEHLQGVGAGWITIALTVFFLLIEINGATNGRILRFFRRTKAAIPAAKQEESCCAHGKE